jgi:penicillin-binding protein 1B
VPRAGARGRGRRPWLRPIGGVLLVAGFAVGFAAAAYIAALDHQVRERFEGTQFRVPSRVYSAPAILYPGLDWRRFGLEDALSRLGYREAPSSRDLPPGQYVWEGSRLRVHLRAFAHPTRPEPARNIAISLRGNAIEDIREIPGGDSLGAVLLEPEALGAYFGPVREQRELVRLADVPQHLVDAVLAVEDQRFATHSGIDFRRIVGAMLANLRAGRVAQGGSTLTQQLVKNFFLTPERTWRRKLREACMALIVEARYDKAAILESYLNEIYLGQRGATAVHGVGEATHLYFGKSVDRLTIAEAGLLAAIIQSPNGISPYRDPERALKRRNLVLELMREQGRLDPERFAQAREEPLQLAAVTPEPGDARFFLDFLHRQLTQIYTPDQLTAEGLRIYSTLDRRLQRIAAQALQDGLKDLERRHPVLANDPAHPLQGCLVVLRPQTGELLALVGGRDYRDSQFDRCSQGRRQPGSVFKPFVYIAGLEEREGLPVITLASTLDDTPLEVATPSGPWRPKNFDNEFHGRVGVREAIERSMNVATVRLARDVGLRNVVDVAQRLGIESALPAVPSLALGTAEVSPLELARAYATLASGGVRPETQAVEDIVDAGGGVLARRELRFQRVLDPGTAYLATSLLEGVAERGTAAAVRAGGLRGPVAAKTGTTDEERDLWFMGFTPDLVAVVWIGFDDPRSVGLPGAAGALPVWRRFVEEESGGTIRGAFPRPTSLERAEISDTGAVALSGCPDEHHTEYFLPGTLPTTFCPDGQLFGRRTDRVERRERGFFQWLREQF